MTEEEYFRKHYPDVCYNGKPLSPYWDLFQDGVEFGERQSEKKIEELEQKLEQTEKDLADYQFNYPKIKELEEENNKLLDVINGQDVKIADLEKENAELKEKLKPENCLKLLAKEGYIKFTSDNLTKAKEIILKLYNAGRDVLMCRAEEKAYDNLENAINDRSIEQFLKEIEK